ncbi:MAG: signal recognition particle-docking protein FtsY [Candidatus Marinimicrobia bacterium]|nr:signal recognition particle-docking protein FtsY [Candidatus Neomarinimicrobiota bacterium]MCF7830154.1 signal recognition particle-docking protein FtsY [Candidatus Neomarinimicrobiota bacterium]MCF7882112.1 signal recognition particle-docking protein FtsY [Candidatus Neomarinimicrobiota bacterium]
MRSAFQKLKSGLKKTHESVVGKISDVFSGRTSLDDDLLDDLEEILIEADLGVDATMRLLDDLRDRAKELDEIDMEALEHVLQDEIKLLLPNGKMAEETAIRQKPHVIMVVGVNGSGKTTTIGKLAHRLKNEGKSVLIGAADTFRAAAMEQLEDWAGQAQVDIIANKQAKDPASVAFDAAAAANSREVDVLIVDTAGRLHTQGNLMEELQKIHRVLGKQIQDAPHEVLLVLDATTGQNAIMQARQFNKAVETTGIALTKLDGTAKGGVVVAINRELDIPVKYIGIGEGIDDLQPFDPEQFAEALFY